MLDIIIIFSFVNCSDFLSYGVFSFLQERVLKCVELIRDLSLISVSANFGAKSTPFVPQSPVGVLDGGCLSYKSDELTVGSCPNSSHNSPNTKRSKSDGPSNGTSKS